MRMIVPPRKGERLLPALSALLLVLSMPPLHLLVPPFVALVPFAAWVAGLPAGREGRAAALRGGTFLGILYFGILLYWILIALLAFTAFAILAYLAVLALLVLTTAFFGWTLHRLTHGAGVERTRSLPLWLALPLAWTAAEWIQGNLGDLSFPWLGLGSTLTGFPALVGIAELVGARGVTFWLALSNGLLATVLLRSMGGRQPANGRPGGSQPVPGLDGARQPVRAHEGVRLPFRGHVAALALVILLPTTWGAWRSATLEMRPVGDVALVQPNIPPEVKFDPERATDSTFRALETLMPQLEGPVDLVVWPEVTLPEIVRHPDQATLRERVRRMAAAAESEILFGGYGSSAPAPGDDPVIYNSAFLMTPEGLAESEYAKRRLVPVIERIPFVRANMFGDLGYYGTLGRGEAPVPVPVGDSRFGVLICYESIFAGASRASRQAGAELLVNITNDAWYGRESWYGRTTALWQHPAHMVMRAIENRVGVARAANTGFSFFVDPAGRVYGRTALSEPALSRATVYTTDVVTLFTRTGDVTGTVSALLVLLLLTGGWWRARSATP